LLGLVKAEPAPSVSIWLTPTVAESERLINSAKRAGLKPTTFLRTMIRELPDEPPGEISTEGMETTAELE
jgi:hypothetical protein